MSIVIMMTIIPAATDAATVKNKRDYAEEMMKATGNGDCIVVALGSKNKDGSRNATMYHYYLNGRAHLRKHWSVIIGRYIKTSTSRVYYIGHGKKRVDFEYNMAVNNNPNLCKQRYFMMADGIEISSYVQYKVANNSFKYPNKWTEDKTGKRNVSNIGMQYKWAKYVFELDTGLPMVFV